MSQTKIIFAVALLGCGSRSGLGLDDVPVADDAFFHADAADTSLPAARCPTALPSFEGEDGGPCDDPRLTCELDGDLDPYCNRAWHCADGRWVAQLPVPSYAAYCPTPLDAGLDRHCPYDRSAVVVGSSCEPDLRCPYPDGRCECSGGRWFCGPRAAACSRARPRLGSPCTVADVDCTYGGNLCVDTEFMIAQECQGGIWRERRRINCR